MIHHVIVMITVMITIRVTTYQYLTIDHLIGLIPPLTCPCEGIPLLRSGARHVQCLLDLDKEWSLKERIFLKMSYLKILLHRKYWKYMQSSLLNLLQG
jgi:hypothetical protein